MLANQLQKFYQVCSRSAFDQGQFNQLASTLWSSNPVFHDTFGKLEGTPQVLSAFKLMSYIFDDIKYEPISVFESQDDSSHRNVIVHAKSEYTLRGFKYTMHLDQYNHLTLDEDNKIISNVEVWNKNPLPIAWWFKPLLSHYEKQWYPKNEQ